MPDNRLNLLVDPGAVNQWSKHRQQWKSCRRCHLADKRCQVVLARGQLPAAIVVIGEAPGLGEDAVGYPFVGYAGRLLDEWIETGWEMTGLTVRPSLAITNAVGCAPYDKFRRIQVPDADSLAACYQRVLDILMICEPKCTVLTGRIAHSLIGDQFNALAGTIFKCFHPSFTRRTGGQGHTEGIHAFRDAYLHAAKTT